MLGMNENSNPGKQRMPVSGRIGLVLKQLRLALGIKQEDAATQADMTPVAVSRMENGLTCSAADSYEREAEVLGVNYEVVVALAAALARRDDWVLTPQEIALALASRRL
jgi:transcriptional regulator with XRE-family HTH domain